MASSLARRKCATIGCGTVLRSGNAADYCSLCDSKMRNTLYNLAGMPEKEPDQKKHFTPHNIIRVKFT